MHIETMMGASGALELTGSRALKRRRAAMLRGVRKVAAEIQRHHKRKEMVRKGGRLATASSHATKLTRRTGTLSRSYSIRLDEHNLAAMYGSDSIVAPVHEFGATIRTKRAPWLVFKIPGVGWRRAKQVTIPPRPTLRRSMQAILGKAGKIVSKQKGLDGA